MIIFFCRFIYLKIVSMLSILIPSFHPLLEALFFFIFGIYSSAFNYILLNASISIMLSFLIKKNTPSIFLLNSVFLLGAFLYQQRITHQQKFFEVIDQNKKYDLYGTITSLQEVSGKRHAYYCTLKKATISDNDFKRVIYDNCSLGVYCNTIQNFEIDDAIYVHDVTFRKPKSLSYQQHLCKENIVTTIFLSSKSIPKLMQRPNISLARWIFNKRKTIILSLQKKMLPKTYTFFSSLFLGYKNDNRYFQVLKEHFKRWGLSHYLARSGLHLILFIALWQLLFRCIALPFVIKHLLLTIMIMLYFLLSWTSIPFTRSCLTYLGYVLGTLCNKQIEALHTLTVVVWIILLINPMYLFALDFQLSFGLTFALIWFSRITHNKLKYISH